ncbi:MAG TPA: BBP7 family outer membrane beta-barrel protein [Gemmataceae bacterium]|nr:BBP7 family outer membrane beta-barrel protein [Gemmataceae bacterium]
MRLTCVFVLAILWFVPAGALAQMPFTPVPSPTTMSATEDSILTPADSANVLDPWYASSEFILWWLREGHVPPLLTTSSFASAGRLGEADTRVLYGEDSLQTRHGDRFNGVRLTLGYALDAEGSWAVEGRAFLLERDSTYYKTVSNGDVLLARPYINALTGLPDSEVIAGPIPQGLRTGGFVGYSRVELFGEEANLVAELASSPSARLDLLVGAHFLQMRDRLDLTATGRLLPDQTTLFGLTDHLHVHDCFYGGQTGLRGEFVRGRWFVNVQATVALGGTVQTIEAYGDRTYQTPQQKIVQPFGLAVLPSNRGTFGQTDFDVVAETGVNVGYQLTQWLRTWVGYNFLYWNNPIRAGDQVDVVVNPTQLQGPLVGPARPTVPFHEATFWAQGLTAGVEFRW